MIHGSKRHPVIPHRAFTLSNIPSFAPVILHFRARLIEGIELGIQRLSQRMHTASWMKCRPRKPTFVHFARLEHQEQSIKARDEAGNGGGYIGR